MRLLRRVAVMAASVTMLGAMGVGLAGSASATPNNATAATVCVFTASTPGSTFVCFWRSPIGAELTVALEAGYVYDVTTDGSYRQIVLGNAGECVQAFSHIAYNGGWSVRLEGCGSSSGQQWRAVTGPTRNGFRTYYWVNEYNPAYCLAWDQNAGTVFANTCRDAWYQEFGLNFY
jgi:hypothetical protein